MARVKRGEGAVRARARALHGAAHRVHAAHERPLRRHRPRGAARQRRPHAQRIEDSPFTKGVRDAMGDFFARDPRRLRPGRRARPREIHDMMRAMYARFAHEHGLERLQPPPFSMLKYQKEIERLERAYNDALQHAVEHGEQGQVRADAALLRDDRARASSTSTTSRTATSRAWLQGGDVAARDAGPRASHAAAAAARQRQAASTARAASSRSASASSSSRARRSSRNGRGCSSRWARST